jgi:PIN like domain
VRFFFDNCVSVRFVQALRILAQIQEYELVHLTERFAADTPDEEWIRRLASDGDWVIISDDPRISRGQAQRKTWQESGLTAFFFADGWAAKDSGSKQKAWCIGGPKSFLKRENQQRAPAF